VMVPGHFYVRARTGGVVRNIELLHQGEETPDEFYRQRYPLPDPPTVYGRALSVTEVLAVVLFNIGNERRRQNRLDEAEDLFRRAAAAFPEFAEAHASLGLTLHLERQLQKARVAYAAAQRAQPHLPGLDRNIAALEADLNTVRMGGRPPSAR
jgi:tetratricopeptide (TPR) repeat protein